MVVIGNALGIFQDGMTATPPGELVAPLLVPVYPLPEESVIAFWSSSFHQAVGEKDIAVSGVPKLNKLEICVAVRAELNIDILLKSWLP